MKLYEDQSPIASLSMQLVTSYLENDKELIYQFNNKDRLYIARQEGEFYELGRIDYIQVGFGEYAHDYMNDGSDAWLTFGTQYFAPSKSEEAVACFLRRLGSDTVAHVDNSGEKLEVIKIRQTKVLEFDSHYHYLNAMLEKFWLKVFDKTPSEMWCGGIVSAHADKCYCYKAQWAAAGIKFHHGALLYLLTYTKELGDTPKHESVTWVQKRYKHYLPTIVEAEREVLREKYGIQFE